MRTPGPEHLGLHPGSVTYKVVNLKLAIHFLCASVSLAVNVKGLGESFPLRAALSFTGASMHTVERMISNIK